MKATELMIGDLVNIAGFIEPRAHAITAIKPDEFGDYFALLEGDDVWWDITCLAPIPLTHEILEKNGFVKDKEEKTHGTTYHILSPTGYEANSYTIQITLYKEPICGVSVLLKIWGWIPTQDGGINDIHLCGAKYVHELQHALRLCGIEKEIVL